MALIKCPECGREISSNAAACPHCGNPVPKKMCPVHIERNREIALLIGCMIYIDGKMYGELKVGESIDLKLPVGEHNISTESYQRDAFTPAATRQNSAEQFTIDENMSSVEIVIRTTGGWFGAAKCVVDSVIYHH